MLGGGELWALGEENKKALLAFSACCRATSTAPQVQALRQERAQRLGGQPRSRQAGAGQRRRRRRRRRRRYRRRRRRGRQSCSGRRVQGRGGGGPGLRGPRPALPHAVGDEGPQGARYGSLKGTALKVSATDLLRGRPTRCARSGGAPPDEKSRSAGKVGVWLRRGDP